MITFRRSSYTILSARKYMVVSCCRCIIFSKFSLSCCSDTSESESESEASYNTECSFYHITRMEIVCSIKFFYFLINYGTKCWMFWIDMQCTTHSVTQTCWICHISPFDFVNGVPFRSKAASYQPTILSVFSCCFIQFKTYNARICGFHSVTNRVDWEINCYWG